MSCWSLQSCPQCCGKRGDMWGYLSMCDTWSQHLSQSVLRVVLHLEFSQRQGNNCVWRLEHKKEKNLPCTWTRMWCSSIYNVGKYNGSAFRSLPHSVQITPLKMASSWHHKAQMCSYIQTLSPIISLGLEHTADPEMHNELPLLPLWLWTIVL